MPHWHTEITSASPDDQPPLEPLEELPAGELNEAMMDHEYIIKFFSLKGLYLHEIPFPSFAVLCCDFVTKIMV